MLSDKVLQIMRKHEIPVLPGMTDKEGWTAIYAEQKRNARAKPSVSICFTGFGASIVDDMKAKAGAVGFGVNSSVAKSTTHLCCGDNAGAKKIEAARAQGVKVISQDDFHHMVETGEIL